MSGQESQTMVNGYLHFESPLLSAFYPRKNNSIGQSGAHLRKQDVLEGAQKKNQSPPNSEEEKDTAWPELTITSLRLSKEKLPSVLRCTNLQPT